jgi:hypothetical protein
LCRIFSPRARFRRQRCGRHLIRPVLRCPELIGDSGIGVRQFNRRVALGLQLTDVPQLSRDQRQAQHQRPRGDPSPRQTQK